ncbi:MAG: hypothetical protein F4Y74_02505 [Gemmatimonadales bacterium]|nr:hypothetical protein [Gemmatimonadales bacterium]MYG19144.1 hypothetical protein [Gemmatimonadales bacterium]
MTRTRMGSRSVLGAGLVALTALGALAALAPADAAAQVPGGRLPGQPPGESSSGGNGTQWDLGATVSLMAPHGQFSSFVNEGFGGALTALLGFEDSPAFRVRFDAGYVNYGSETLGVPVFSVTDRILTDIVTRNNVGYLGLGPEIRLPYGPVQPFVNGFAGLGYFFTVSSVEHGWDLYDSPYDGTTVNFDDVRAAYGFGGGLSIPFNWSAKPVLLRLEAQYRRHGRTEYLVPGSIVEDGFGGSSFSPIASDVDFVLFQLGLTFRV